VGEWALAESMVGALLLGGMKRADLPPPPPRGAFVRHEVRRALGTVEPEPDVEPDSDEEPEDPVGD
jgi:hypothetical protein